MDTLIRKSLKDVAIEKIKQYIVEHNLQPGDPFPNEKEIIELLGVSRTVVREALKSLETIGILKLKPGDGIFVSNASLEQLMDQFYFRWFGNQQKMMELQEIRLILEVAAVELVIMRAEPQMLNELDEWNDKMEQAIRNSEPLIEQDIGFHRTLFKLTGNESFYEFSEVISKFFMEVRHKRLSASGGRVTLDDHRRITQSIKEKNIGQAKEHMLKHLSKSRALKEPEGNGT
ncbi:FadR family transcriptional regulator [Paenibacillus mesophilus]|uniref:FadR/GntR family transcriptional regulator n=1 Tax=Paenibacillus mesophilus TaxID=2582849 RepID=UPI00110EE717|nr:FadR/GntR family transcriptional regulator [Paenibacillus mesophilus]TMV45644.1 FadR family transcriptional regulator [Paenibacillus mesophilus]